MQSEKTTGETLDKSLSATLEMFKTVPKAKKEDDEGHYHPHHGFLKPKIPCISRV